MLNFQAVLAALGGSAAVFRIANAARAAGDYLLASLLPEIQRNDYTVTAGNMTVKATMAGLVGMDSPYPPGGMVSASYFMEQTAKIANSVRLNEKALRELQRMVQVLQLGGGDTNEALTQEVLNFFDKVVMQPHLDTFEWLRAQALFTGAINWTFGKIPLVVSYGVPAAHFLPTRTTVGGTAYGAADSAFWSDVRELSRILKGNVRALIAHPDTLDEIIYNDANGMRVVTDTGIGPIRTVSLQRFARDAAGDFISGQDSNDARDRTTIIAYAREAEIINPANPETTIQIPFAPRGKLLAVGNNTDSGYIVGRGSQEEDPNESNRLGYTHIGPTVEGNGAPGRWGRMYTPENTPWALIGQAVTNGLPVIESPDKIAVATTELA